MVKKKSICDECGGELGEDGVCQDCGSTKENDAVEEKGEELTDADDEWKDEDAEEEEL